METPDWMERVDTLLKESKPLRMEHLRPMKKMLDNMDKYQDLLIELLTTLRAMRAALKKRIERLEYHGY